MDRIDLLLLYVVMPRMSGAEVFEKIRTLSPDVKVIFTSGYSADVIEKTILKYRDITLLSKPVSPDKLLQKIKDVIEV